METLSSILAFVIVLGIIVLVHEFGHFIAARLMGVRVEVFSIGFGKRLFGRKIGETDFRLSLIPLGGYVKMAGEEEYDPLDPKPYEFHAKNRAQKIFILFMGPFMNLLLAFLIYTVINMTGVEIVKYHTEPPVLGYVGKHSPAADAGLKPGDLILTINDQKIKDWKFLQLTIASSPDEELEIKYKRDGEEKTTTLKVKKGPKTRYSMGEAGILWKFKAQVSGVIPDKPADKAGIKPNDIVLSVNGTPVTYFDFSEKVSPNVDAPLALELKRGDQVVKHEVTPQRAYHMESKITKSEEDANKIRDAVLKRFPDLQLDVYHLRGDYQVKTGFFFSKDAVDMYADKLTENFTVKESGRIGVTLTPWTATTKKQFGLWPAMVRSKNEIADMTFFIFTAFKKMVVGKISTDQLAGPIEIAKVSQKAMENGPSSLFLLIAFISIQLCIVNLFPIPALDGGHLMIYSIEAIVRREFSQRVKIMMMNIGFLLLVAIMVFVILNDISKIMPNGWASFWPF